MEEEYVLAYVCDPFLTWDEACVIAKAIDADEADAFRYSVLAEG